MIIGRVALAQEEYPQQLAISRPILAGASSDQKAVETIVATNGVDKGATGIYTAGKSVLLQAGFVAHPGSVFSATVDPVSSWRLKSDMPGLSAQAYPNPFVERTTIEYNLPVNGRVQHTLMDMKGEVVRQTEGTSEQSKGLYKTQLEGNDIPTGTYLYRIQVGNESRTIRLLKKP
ncbi:T9SS type A sorting domain-containing protein [Spirosoma telluris]